MSFPALSSWLSYEVASLPLGMLLFLFVLALISLRPGFYRVRLFHQHRLYVLDRRDGCRCPDRSAPGPHMDLPLHNLLLMVGASAWAVSGPP